MEEKAVRSLSEKHKQALVDGHKRYLASRPPGKVRQYLPPEDLLKCSACQREKPRGEYVGGGRKEDAHRRFCRACRELLKTPRGQWELWCIKALGRAKLRAKRDGKRYDLTLSHLMTIIPRDGQCPVFKKPLVLDIKDMLWNPSLDRVDNGGGYTQDNVVIVSNLANRSKGPLTNSQLLELSTFYNRPPPGESPAKWPQRFLRLAREVASWSRDPSTKVGAVLVSPDRTDVVLGYNGFPRGMPDRPELLNNREEKYDRTCHAEVNAVLLARRSVAGYTLYTWPMLPCQRCMVQMLQAGVVKFVSVPPPEDQTSRWSDSMEKAKKYALECGASVEEVPLGTT